MVVKPYLEWIEWFKTATSRDARAFAGRDACDWGLESRVRARVSVYMRG